MRPETGTGLAASARRIELAVRPLRWPANERSVAVDAGVAPG